MRTRPTFEIYCKTKHSERCFIVFSVCDLLTFLEDPCEASELESITVYYNNKAVVHWSSELGYFEDDEC